MSEKKPNSMANAKKAEQAVRTARKYLIADHPFFGVLSLRPRLVPTAATKTMATDGKHFYFNPDFILSQERKQIEALLAKSALHTAFAHHLRRAKRVEEIWQAACDYAVTPALKKSGFTLPKGALYDPKFDGKTAEKIYDILWNQLSQQQKDELQQKQQQRDEARRQKARTKGGQGQPDPNGKPVQGEGQPAEGEGQPGEGQGQGQEHEHGTGGHPGEVWDLVKEDGSDLSQGEKAQEEREVQSDVLQGNQAEKSCGSGSANALRQIAESMVAVKVDWWQVLEDKLMARKTFDATFAKPNRRLLGHGYILPGIHTEQTGELVLAVDTSGSLGEDELSFIAKHMREIVAKVEPERVHVIYCDASIKKVQTFEKGDTLELKMYGGGGTAFSPPFEHVHKEGWEPDAMIYFTDGYGSVNRLTGGVPSYPVIWATTGQPPQFSGIERFGDVIKIE